MLQSFDTATFCCIIKYQTRTCDKFEKCGHGFVFCMLKFILNNEHSRTALIFCLRLKKTAAESHRLLRKAYGEHAPPQDTYMYVNDGFGVSEAATSMLQIRNMENRQKIRGCEIANIIWRRWFANIKANTKKLSVSQRAVSNRLRKMGKTQKTQMGITWVGWQANGKAQKTCDI